MSEESKKKRKTEAEIVKIQAAKKAAKKKAEAPSLFSSPGSGNA